MSVHLRDPVPPDVEIERQVDRAVREGCSLPRWGWAIPANYNGSTGRERILGWQKVMIAERLGLLGSRGGCTACDARRADHRHSEIYFRPLISLPVCRSCHFQIHRRFRDPGGWQRFLDHTAVGSGWIRSLKLTEVDRDQAKHIAAYADIFVALEAT